MARTEHQTNSPSQRMQQRGRAAVEETLFERNNPAGRLSVTLHSSPDQLPSFDSSMNGRAAGNL
jgi:hypothetical protein